MVSESVLHELQDLEANDQAVQGAQKSCEWKGGPGGMTPPPPAQRTMQDFSIAGISPLPRENWKSLQVMGEHRTAFLMMASKQQTYSFKTEDEKTQINKNSGMETALPSWYL